MLPFDVSVCIPLYNKRDHIAAALRSVYAQTRAALEVIVVDDGSKDDSAAIVAREFPQVRLFQQANGGVSAARNQAVSLARGNYVAFLDADDYWSPHVLMEFEMLAHRYPESGALACAYQYRDGEGRFGQPKIRAASSWGVLESYFESAGRGDLPFCASSVAVSRALLSRIGGFPVGEPMGEDQDLWARIALNSTIAYSPRRLAVYRRDASDRACQRHLPKAECAFSRRLALRAAELPPGPAKLELERYTATHLLHLASQHHRCGNFPVAARLLQEPRTRRLPVKRRYWMLKVAWKKALHAVWPRGSSAAFSPAPHSRS